MSCRTPVPDLIGDDPDIHPSSRKSFEEGWIAGVSNVQTRFALCPAMTNLSV
jgi:hypothetical protein